MVYSKGLEPVGELLVSSDAFHPILTIEGRVGLILQAARMGDLSLGAHVHVPRALSPVLGESSEAVLVHQWDVFERLQEGGV